VFEKFFRQSGLKTFIIQDGSLMAKPQLGFSGGNLVKPLAKTAAPLPTVFKLYDSYPNPFNSNCIIKFAIPKESWVKIEIFNILGQKVTTLVEESKEPGEYAVIFKANEFSSGAYFYTLNTGDFSESKSTVLVK
jgi:hypothetical protein